MRKVILFLDELKPVSPEYKEQMTAFILLRHAMDERAASILKRTAARISRKRNKKLPNGWDIFANRDCVIETEVDANLWLEHFKDTP